MNWYQRVLANTVVNVVKKQKFENFDLHLLFFLFDGNETLHSRRTCKYTLKIEITIFVTVTVSMATI